MIMVGCGRSGPTVATAWQPLMATIRTGPTPAFPFLQGNGGITRPFGTDPVNTVFVGIVLTGFGTALSPKAASRVSAR